MEYLRPVQTLGFDRVNGFTAVSAASGTGTEPSAAVRAAGSIEAALTELQNAFPEAEPYYAHVQYVLIGTQAAADGVDPYLRWLVTRPELRLDSAVFAARDSAAELILGTAGEKAGSAEKLGSLESGLKRLGEGQAVSVRALTAALTERGAGFCGAVRYGEPDGTMPYEDAGSLRPDGFALFQNGALAGFIEQTDALGVLLVTGECGGARIKTDAAVLAVERGHTQIRRRDNTVTLTARIRASVIEPTPGTDDATLTQALADAAADALHTVAQRERELDADFFGLTGGRSPAQKEFIIRVHARLERGAEG